MTKALAERIAKLESHSRLRRRPPVSYVGFMCHDDVCRVLRCKHIDGIPEFRRAFGEILDAPPRSFEAFKERWEAMGRQIPSRVDPRLWDAVGDCRSAFPRLSPEEVRAGLVARQCGDCDHEFEREPDDAGQERAK